MTGIYLYAITPGDCQSELGRLGLPDGCTRVTALRRNGLAAVVSTYRGGAFDQLPKAGLLRLLAIHQQVIERAMADHPVLPVKFGTVLASSSEVSESLDRWNGPLSSALSQMRDVVEIELAASWDLAQTFAEIARQPCMMAMKESVVGRPETETVAIRVQIGKFVKEELDRRRGEYRQQVVGDLACIARDAQSNPLLSDELVMNEAFLVERASLDDFYTRVQQLDRTFQNRLSFRCIGPLPPYSFGTVEIKRPHAEDIEAARRMLGLGLQASEAEVTASYRRLAALYHPDHNPENPLAAGRFAALATARVQLMDYLHGQQAIDGQCEEDRRCDLAPTAVEASLLLAIKRPRTLPTPFARAS